MKNPSNFHAESPAEGEDDWEGRYDGPTLPLPVEEHGTSNSRDDSVPPGE